MSTQEDFLNEPPRKQGMSSTAKVLIILGSIAGVCMLVCCGGGVFVWFKAKDAIQNFAQNFSTNDPQEIRARTAKIVHIDIPEQFPPMLALDLMFMKEIVYGTPNRSMVMIIEMGTQMLGPQGQAGGKQQRDEILRQMKQQGQQPGMNTDLNVRKAARPASSRSEVRKVLA